MMKRLLAVLLFAATALSFAATAHSWELFSTTVPFRYQRGLTTSQVVVLPYDSTVAVSVVPTTSVYTAATDTTVSLDTRAWSYHGPYGTNWSSLWIKGSIIDTIPAFTVIMKTQNGLAFTGLDSMYVTPQISADNVTWVAADTLGVTQTLATVGVATTPYSTSIGGIGAKRINWDRQAANYIRFLLHRDVSAAGAGVEIQVAGRKN
jgi:hypothetical protein